MKMAEMKFDLTKVVDGAIKEFKHQGYTVSKWVSCKDKMPKDNELVLFCYVSENGVKSVHYGYHQTIKGLGSSWAKPSGGWQYADDDVTHWQPLPEPPKDGEQNDD
jgi:hypothetical protein